MKNKLLTTFKSIFRSLKSIDIKRYKFSLSTQITFTLILVFISFFVLQIILNSQFFHNYYTDKEFDIVDERIAEYITTMNNSNNNYHEEMFEFVSSQNAYSVITTKSFRLLESSYTDYTIILEDNSNNEQLSVIIPDNTLSFREGEQVTTLLAPYNEDTYFPYEITNETLVYQHYEACEDVSCRYIEGTIISIRRPNNLNYLFADNISVQNELNKLSTNSVNLQNHEYRDGFWYRSTDGSMDTLVFINELKNWDYIITIVPIEDTDIIIGIITQYNYYVYLTALAIIFLWSFRLSTIISKPIQKIDEVAKDIAHLKFDHKVNEQNNKETSSLSTSMNLISNNLRDALESLNKKNTELETLYEAKMKQSELKKRLVSSISHELKTPLMIIQVIIQGIADGVIEEKDIEAELATVLEEVHKSSIMIQDLLQIYRLDDKEVLLDQVEFNIRLEISSLLQEFDQLIRKQELVIQYDKKNAFLEADKSLINRVLSNFLTNALKYTPKGEKIEINTINTSSHTCIEIINHGVNIPNSELDNIWLPFYRGSQTNHTDKKQSGSGIGLYLVKEILKAHNADFGIKNQDNACLAFFCIPNKK